MRDAPVDQLLAEVLDLADARADVVVVHRLDDAAGHGLHVAAGQAAVGVQALVDHDHVPRLLEELLVVHRQPAADVDHGVLLGAHRAGVGVGAELLEDFGHRLRLVARLALLNEIGVLDRAGGVENDPQCRGGRRIGGPRGHWPSTPAARRPCSPWPERQMYGIALAADLLDQLLQRGEVHVALEGMLARRIVAFRDDHVDERAAGQFLVQPGGGEIHVARHASRPA